MNAPLCGIANICFNDDDQYGCRFHSVHAMIGDAWDVRAVRKLQEYGLLTVVACEDKPQKANVWNITDKGNFIAMAIEADADGLKQLSSRMDWKLAT